MEIIDIPAPESALGQVVLYNPKTGEKACILPNAGACLVDLQLQFDHKLIQLIKLPGHQSILENPLYPSALLAPWVNRVRNGNYSFEGRNYQLAINELPLGNAIHGFLARQNFRIHERICNEDFAQVSFIHEHQGDFKGYPFPFEFILSYTLSSHGKLMVQFKCKNMGEANMPFACGWHPYFTIDHADLSSLEIKFNPSKRYLSDAQMIPMAEESVNFNDPVRFAETKLDHVFKLVQAPFHTTELTDTGSGISLFLKQNSIDFPFLVVFAPENENCVAIEPMTSNTDAFNTEDGLIQLKPREEFDSLVEIWIDICQN